MGRQYFRADQFHDRFGGHPPVMTLDPGMVLETHCVDAYGVDADGHQLTRCDNPLTGPFSIAGAEPGDTLVVELKSISPNRDYGTSENTPVPSIVDPDIADIMPARRTNRWIIDKAAGVARPAQASGAAVELAVPLSPMLGCIGVAPDKGQSIWCGTSGRYGGNMDSPLLGSGSTLYLPVFEPGAMLYLGDGHAAQGDGEICGAGIEVSVDVVLAVNVIKGRQVMWPRGEDGDWIWVVGNARSLEMALRYSASEMLRWLMAEFEIEASAACMLLAQSAKFDIANATNPMVTVACRLAKSRFLSSRRRAPARLTES
ncbi:acetamidase/formamidase family protein [Roseovarius sp. M141]|uniref:acetamidase/formamidase family protein n=1 Tax=Roseovarius sp. M141 TaxID=2583806 RepID=UPI0020CC38D8|nr:acetamidase/formamidase family protein [Roseovarius sp. M141]